MSRLQEASQVETAKSELRAGPSFPPLTREGEEGGLPPSALVLTF